MMPAEAEPGAAVDGDALDGSAGVPELPFTKPLQSPQ
jgi:hypothetical protein